MTKGSIVISAILGEKGRGADGDLMVWRSTDGGKQWSEGRAINDVAGAAREGLHSMASGGGETIFATWLDLRGKGTKIYGSLSLDGGVTWSRNRVVYESPSGSVCECCHPSAFVDHRGGIYVMFRNAMDGNRDMYLVRSKDGGLQFGLAEKLGTGNWFLNACPMDGGSFTVKQDGGVVAAWRREGDLYLTSAGHAERRIATGRQPVVAANDKDTWIAWTEGKAIRWMNSERGAIHTMGGEAAFLSLAVLPSGKALVAGERNGRIFVEELK